MRMEYPLYKETLIDWIGAVPAHWQVDRLKWSVESCRNGVWGAEPDDSPSDTIVVRVADFDRTRLAVSLESPTYRAISDGDRRDRELNTGDLLLEKSGGGEGQPVGVVVQYDDPRPAVCSNFVARMVVAKDMHSRFWCYLHSAAYAARVNVRSIKQTSGIQNLDQSSYLNEIAPFPPLPEQIAIAGFLDRETAKVDALVEEQKRLIALLKEKRQAVVAHAVTKGVNSGVPMKDTGIGWVGQVPEHWEVCALSRITLEKCDGPFGSGLKSEHYQEHGVRVIRLQNIRAAGFDGFDAAFIAEDYYRAILRGGHSVMGGDLLVAGLGDDNHTVGRACVAPADIEPALVKADCFRFRIDQQLASPEFLAMQISAGAHFDAGMLSSGSTRSRIPLSLMASRRVALPPLDEQHEIVREVNHQLSGLEHLLSEAEGGISLLMERRAALISAAVTGKIDVRALVEVEDAA